MRTYERNPDCICYQNEVCQIRILSIHCVYEVFSHIRSLILDKYDMIYNPINRDMISHMAEEKGDINVTVPLIISSGRLVYQKAFDVLLKAFRKVRDHVEAKPFQINSRPYILFTHLLPSS